MQLYKVSDFRGMGTFSLSRRADLAARTILQHLEPGSPNQPQTATQPHCQYALYRFTPSDVALQLDKVAAGGGFDGRQMLDLLNGLND